MKHYLLDASSFMILIKKAEVQRTVECLRESVVLDLTFYEVGNAIWKESALTKSLAPGDGESLGNLAQTILANTDRIMLDVTAFQGILKIAGDEMLSFYDSSYVYFSKEKGLTLVTEDKTLKTKAKKYVNIQAVAELLNL